MTNSALLIIDVQNCMFNPVEPVYNSQNILTNLQSLISRARAAQTPVIHIQHNGPEGAPNATGLPGWEIHPDVAPQSGEPVIQKTTPDSFCRTNLQETLTEMGIEQLVIAGIQTDYCVDTTCRRASSEGYQITLAGDAHSTWSNDHISAEQVIGHHNDVLGNWFAKVEATADIQFE